MKRKPRYLSIGSVSSGTMRPEDLIPSFLWECDRLRLTKEERETVNRIKKASDVDEDSPYWQSEECSLDLNEHLFEILNNHCPDYTYFGSHEGDGSDYGCWPSMDCIRDGDVPDADSLPKGYSGTAVSVNDHGNVTLFSVSNGRRKILWDCV